MKARPYHPRFPRTHLTEGLFRGCKPSYEANTTSPYSPRAIRLPICGNLKVVDILSASHFTKFGPAQESKVKPT